MNLVVFDIDGTLTRTNEADERCFEKAVADQFQIEGVVTDWGAYTHSTDSGIIHELVERNRGRGPELHEVKAFQNTFVRHLESHYDSHKGSFDCVPGSKGILARLNHTPSHRVALATGGWKVSALLKLKKAGISFEGVPAAFADDHFSRDDIIQTAVTRAKETYGRKGFDSIVYVGDGRWDLKSCQRLGIPFVGVADVRGRDYLAREGASDLIDDYSDFDSFFRLLNR